MSIHSRIKTRRQELGLRMQDVSDACNFKSWQTVQAWEAGKAAPSRVKMPLVAKALKVSEEWLVHGYNSAALTDRERNILAILDSLTDEEYRQVIEFAQNIKDKKVEAIEHARALLKKLIPESGKHVAPLTDEENQLMQLLMSFSNAKPSGRILIEAAAKTASAKNTGAKQSLVARSKKAA